MRYVQRWVKNKIGSRAANGNQWQRQLARTAGGSSRHVSHISIPMSKTFLKDKGPIEELQQEGKITVFFGCFLEVNEVLDFWEDVLGRCFGKIGTLRRHRRILAKFKSI